jgi:hydroxymethylpyrimidine pyrophosphatase-like HAD family hydrolase
MRYHALACDYDGTLAHDGQVDDATVAGLRRLAETGRKLVLVTGRELDDLKRAFDQVDLFDLVVAENGALLYRPGDRSESPLGDRPPDEFVRALRQREVDPLSVGRVIVATWHPNEDKVLDAIRELGLELQVIFNKGAVMVLPSGVNKASGLAAALAELGISAHNAVGIGDAENDHAFLSLCECSVAVANALPALAEQCDHVTEGARGAGVVELIDQLAADDLAGLQPRLARHDVVIGEAGEEQVRLPPLGPSLLVAGPSSSGKSSLVTALLERLVERSYQVCLVDPEGEYSSLPGMVHLGDGRSAPTVTEVLDVLDDPGGSVTVNLLGLRLEDQPAFFEDLLAPLQRLRARTGRPHRIVLDEAHHLMPASLDPSKLALPDELEGMVLVAAHPDHVTPAVLALVDVAVVLGADPAATLGALCEAVGQEPPPVGEEELGQREALAWWRRDGEAPVRFDFVRGESEHRRHLRKYAEGELGEDRSFYFTGPDGRLNLRAHNLQIFLQLADGVDDATWMHHLEQGDYSRWLREAVKDEGLAEEAERIEQGSERDPRRTRELLREAIERRYTAPA